MAFESTTPSLATNGSIHRNRGIRDVIEHFTPVWFSVNMGTGVVSALLHSYPYGGNSIILNGFATAFFFLNLVLFCIFLTLTICRYVMFPRLWGLMLRHPVQSLYIGCFPMGAVTLINSGLTLGYQYWNWGGTTFLYTLWGLWWLDTFVSFLCCFGLVYVMITQHEHSMATFTSAWLLPIVTVIVGSSSGQLLAAALIPHSLSNAALTTTFAAFMVILGISLSLMVLTLYLRRLFIEGLPDAGAVLSSFLPLGPCGQAGYSLLLAGNNFVAILPKGNGEVLSDELAGRVLNIICFFCAFVLWCLTIWWLACAVFAVIYTVSVGHKLIFKLPFWGIVFPNGVGAILTIQLATAMDSAVFRVLGACYAAAVMALWLLLAVPTAIQVYDKRIFISPCVLEEKEKLRIQFEIARQEPSDLRLDREK
ncbi:hypothetical protein M422DRAFT_32525 [Sphaerobolus stellatus SS14]|uniref:Sulfite efflux pump SSU1 n=1 Tax=Sphaerobolus stellatus (strain SS14) TaxID=990650 RepID=A0A0C9VQ13_SPHS4|nr:hypothetical protein M422DRAFT_32525 [Sphaerobolus stellatus SS14]